MDLKNALSVCLISLFSATLVVLIARSLDSQAASRLQPELARIASELEAIRTSGGIAATSATASPDTLLRDGLLVYYFHGNQRCPTCRAIEAQSHDTLQADFAAPLASGELVWTTLNYEQPAGLALAKRFDVQAAVVVLARMENGQVAQWKRLDTVWGLVGDKPAFATYMRDEVRGMLAPAAPAATVAPPQDVSDIPLPGEDGSEVPLPSELTELPQPK